MVKRLNNKLLLTPDDFPSADKRFRTVGVFNPGAARYQDDVILLVRVAEETVEKKAGYICSPRAVAGEGKPRCELEWCRLMDDPPDHDPRMPLATVRRTGTTLVAEPVTA